MKPKFTKSINGLIETFTFQRTRQDRDCHMCKAPIKSGSTYANIKFWVDVPLAVTRGRYLHGGGQTLAMPVCAGCADDTPMKVLHFNKAPHQWVVDRTSSNAKTYWLGAGVDS